MRIEHYIISTLPNVTQKSYTVKKVILPYDHIISIALSPTRRKLPTKLDEHNWALTHPLIRVNGAGSKPSLNFFSDPYTEIKAFWFMYLHFKQTSTVFFPHGPIWSSLPQIHLLLQDILLLPHYLDQFSAETLICMFIFHLDLCSSLHRGLPNSPSSSPLPGLLLLILWET